MFHTVEIVIQWNLLRLRRVGCMTCSSSSSSTETTDVDETVVVNVRFFRSTSKNRRIDVHRMNSTVGSFMLVLLVVVSRQCRCV